MIDDDYLDNPGKPEAGAGFWFSLVMALMMTLMVAMVVGLGLMVAFPIERSTC